MKQNFFFLILLLLSFSCIENNKNSLDSNPTSESSKYQKLIEKFHSKEDLEYPLKIELKNWIKDGNKINFSDYKELFKDINFYQDWSPSQNSLDSILALGINPHDRTDLFYELFNGQTKLLASFPNISKNLNFDLFLIQTKSKLILLIGDKEEEKIYNFFQLNSRNKDWCISLPKASRNPEIWYKETVIDSNSNSKFAYEIKTKLTENGQFISNEVLLNKDESLFTIKEGSIIGTYKLKSDILYATISIKEGKTSNKISYKITLLENKTKYCITYLDNDIVLDKNKGFNVLRKDKLLMKIHFKNQHIYIKWDGCLELKSIPCDFNFVAIKEKNS